MEKYMEYCMREDGNDAKTKPFGLEWRIGSLHLWRREAHGDCLATSVDFDGTRVEFKVYPQFPDDGRMEVHFPEELSPYQGLVTIRNSDGRDLCEVRKERGQRVVCLGPQMERFRKILNNQVWKRLVFFFVLEKVDVTARCKYASTIVPLIPHLLLPSGSQRVDGAEFLFGNASVIPQRAPPNDGADTVLGLSLEDRLRRARYSHELKFKKMQARMRERFLAHGRELFKNDQQYHSLLKSAEELNPLTESILSFSEREFQESLSKASRAIRRGRGLGSYPQGQPVPPNGDYIRTGPPTLEQLIPDLGRMSISREVEKSPSSSDPPEGRSAAIASPQCGSSWTIPDVNYRIVEPCVNEYALKPLLDEIHTPTPLEWFRPIDSSHDDVIKRRHELMDCRYNPY